MDLPLLKPTNSVLGVLIFQVSLHAERYFGTITMCPDHDCSIRVFIDCSIRVIENTDNLKKN